MLQNPSKYHANPLSHFLALHNTQANGVAHAHGQGHGHGHGHGQLQPHHTLPTAALAAAAAAAAVTAAGQSSYQMELQSQQQQQLPIGLPPSTQTQPHTHHHHREHREQLATATSHAQLIEAAAAHTSLDVGKSFTIAAILGLQQQSKEYNNAINLSLNGGSSVVGEDNCGVAAADQDNNNSKCYNNNNNNNNNSSSNGNNYNNNSNNNSQSVNNFNCDSSGSRYLSTVQHSHPHPHSHQRANFAAAAAVAAAVSGAPSALQSLQQLHQHHAHQASLSFQRDKLKSESHKKNAMKNKRVRTIFTPEQLECLEAEFERQQYMVGPERLYLAHTLKLTEAQVKVWFQNRRIKWRKHHLELTQQRLALIRQTQLPGGAVAAAATSAVSAAELPLNGACSTASPSLLEEDNEDSKQSLTLPLRELSRAASESDLSICNDSLDLDGDSLMDGSEET